jgi:ribonuclease P protein component
LRVWVKANGLGYPRIGSTFSRRYFPRAVDRNRLKRLLRESIRHNAQLLKGLDLIVSGYESLSSLDNGEVRQLFERLWSDLAARTFAH